MLHVLIGGVGEVANPADPGAGRPFPILEQPRFDRVFELVGQLVAAPGEELQPVVRHRIVARRQHHPDVRPQLRGEVRDRRRRNDADAQDVDTRAGEAGDDRRLEKLPRRTRVAADHGDRPVAFEGTRVAQHVRRRHRQLEHEFGGQMPVRDTAHAVGTEQPHAPGLGDIGRAGCTAARSLAGHDVYRFFAGHGVLPLGVLRSLTCLLQPVLLALDDARVAGEIAGLLQRRSVLWRR